MLASSPAAVDDFLATAGGKAEASFNGSPVRKTAAKHSRDENQALFVDVALLRQFIAENRSFFTGHSGAEKRADAAKEAQAGRQADTPPKPDAPKTASSPTQATTSKPAANSHRDPDLARVEDILKLFDTAFLTVDVSGDRLRIVAGAVIMPDGAQAPATSP